MRYSTFLVLVSGLVLMSFTTTAQAQTCARLFDPVRLPHEISGRTGYLIWSKVGDAWIVRLDDVLMRQASRIAHAQVTEADGRKMFNLRPSLNELIHDWNFKKEDGHSVPVDRRSELPHIEAGMYAGHRVFGIRTRYSVHGEAIEAGTLERYLRFDRLPQNVAEGLRTDVVVDMEPYEGVIRLIEMREIARTPTLVVTIETNSGERIELTSLDAISNGDIRTIYSLSPALEANKSIDKRAPERPRSKSSPRL